MKRSSQEMVREIKEQMRGGEGQVEIVHLFKADEMKGHCRLAAQITLAPGCSVGGHAHDDEEEIFYILSGEATADDNGNPVTLAAGDALKTGGGETHSISCKGNVPLVMLAVILLFK